MSISSKGLDVYGYTVLQAQQVLFKLTEPGADSANTYTLSQLKKLFNRHLEVDSDLPFHLKGDYSFSVADVASKSCEINSVTGNISDSDMNDMLSNQQCVINDTAIMSYGFYDAGSGYGDQDYTSHHQNYVYVSDPHRPSWMANLVAANSDLGDKPFSTFVLPGAHDAGMNTDTYLDDVANNASAVAIAGGILAYTLALPLAVIMTVLAPFTAIQIKQLLINLSLTQKDTISNMMNMGTRYFDFRPGYNGDVKGIKVSNRKGLFHQHTVIPGMAFDDFLTEVVTWLDANQGEIVVVSLGFSGFKDDDMKPTADVLTKAIDAAVANSKTGLKTGNVSDASSTYNTLIENKTRLLFFNNGVGVNDATKDDSYTDDANISLVPDGILAELGKMTSSPKNGEDYTVLQLQGTASGVSDIWPKLALCSSAASSPLLMTKAYFDNQTYQWCKASLSYFDKDYPLVVLNDFVDPALSNIAEQATLDRLNGYSSYKVSDWIGSEDIPGWVGEQTQGGGITVAYNPNNSTNLVSFHIDHPAGGNKGYFKLGSNFIESSGKASQWSGPNQIPGWFGDNNQGGGIAATPLNGGSEVNLVVFHLDSPGGGNNGYFRVGKNLNFDTCAIDSWTNPVAIPGWFGASTAAADIALADIKGNGNLDLIVFHVDNPAGGNKGYYRIGWNLNVDKGTVDSWSDIMEIPGWFGDNTQGGGIAVADITNSGQLDLIVYHIDQPGGGNKGYTRIGSNMNRTDGTIDTENWTTPVNIPGDYTELTTGGGLTITQAIDKVLIPSHIDVVSGGNKAVYNTGVISVS
jgi:hypothetical protein